MSDSATILNKDEIKSLEVLAYFYFRINKFDSAKRALLAILAIEPLNLYAKELLILCNDALEDFDSVLKLTEDLSVFAKDQNKHRALTILKARALQKKGLEQESHALLYNNKG